MPGKRGTARTYRCPPDHKHEATGTCFNQHGCGCFPCVEGRRVYQEQRDKKIAYGRWETDRTKVDATGTRRRVQALAFLGWCSKDIADGIRTRDSHVRHLWRTDTVEQRTKERVEKFYSQVWDKEPPSGRKKKTANLARREGWVGPLHWDDIDKDPEPVITRDVDRSKWAIEELEYLKSFGESAHIAARTIGKKPDTLARLATRHGRHDLAAWVERAGRAA